MTNLINVDGTIFNYQTLKYSDWSMIDNTFAASFCEDIEGVSCSVKMWNSGDGEQYMLISKNAPLKYRGDFKEGYIITDSYLFGITNNWTRMQVHATTDGLKKRLFFKKAEDFVAVLNFIKKKCDIQEWDACENKSMNDPKNLYPLHIWVRGEAAKFIEAKINKEERHSQFVDCTKY